MVGFPGESEEDFLDTVSFVREVGFIDVHVFAYSKRRGTPAASYDGQIEESEKKKRSARLIAAKNEVRDCVLSQIVASLKPLSVVLETYDKGSYSAHSDSFLEIRVDGNDGLQGEIVEVIPLLHKDGVIIAKLI
jgi:threonylcarbamoyladenosine tRNA methylthiotransferase MtaB